MPDAWVHNCECNGAEYAESDSIIEGDSDNDEDDVATHLIVTWKVSTHNGQSVSFLSPGFYRRSASQPKGAYFNRNFCIFNISLDCPDKMAELVPSEHTNSLSDSDTRRDYLSFHTHSSTRPNFKLYGGQIRDASQYQLLPSSFYGVLWTNDNQNESGRFEIEARCTAPSDSDSDAGSGGSIELVIKH